jgi:rhamnosyltransferase
MIELNKLFAIVIWYYPTLKNVENINTYLDLVHRLIIIDNSDVDNSSLLSDFDPSKFIYIANNRNIGMAAALNQGCNLALENKAEWVLTMDQDSRFAENNFPDLINSANNYSDFEKVAIFAPVHFDSRNNRQKPIAEDKYSRIKYTMTSGNLLSLDYLQKAGLFMEDLFIDWIDEEICIRICKMQFQIVQINDIFMEHFVGNGSCKRIIFGKTKHFDDYSPVRYYYITRNLFILCKMYPSEARRIKKRWRKLFRKTVLYDNKNKVLKLKYIFIGIMDFIFGKTGSFSRKLHK